MTRLAKVRVAYFLDAHRSPSRPEGVAGPWRPEDPATYGVEAAAGYVDLFFPADRDEKRVVQIMRRGTAYLLGFDIVHAWRNRAFLNSVDVIWTHTEHEHLAVALLKRFGIVRREVILLGVSIWLWDQWREMSSPRKRLVRWLLDAVDLHATLSRENSRYGADVLGRPVVWLPFGADGGADPLPRTQRSPTIKVVAPGTDRHRDWKTLASVAKAAPDIQITILSRRSAARRAAAGTPARVTAAANRGEVRQAYAAADVVVVPLKQNSHASGVSVMFEALQHSRHLVATKVGGLEDYFGDMCEWARLRDPGSLEAAIRRAAASPPIHDSGSDRYAKIAERGLTIHDFALRHVVVTEYLLGTRKDLEAASALAPVTPELHRE